MATAALDEALAIAHEALALAPENAEVLELVQYRRGAIDEARNAFARAVAAAPGHAHARKNLGMTGLLCGDFETGWQHYAARHVADGTARIAAVPEWRGEGLYGRRLAVTAEQGLGDMIQFLRFLPRLAAMGAHVTFLLSLAELAAAMPGAVDVAVAGGPSPQADLQVALMDVPGLLNIRPDTIPAPVLHRSGPREARTARRGLRGGIVWRGNPRHRGDRHRSIAADRLCGLAAVEGVQLYSLQVGEPR